MKQKGKTRMKSINNINVVDTKDNEKKIHLDLS